MRHSNLGILRPTADNPLIFTVRAHPASLKNDKVWDKKKQNFVSSKDVESFMNKIYDAVDRQLDKNWKPIPSPTLCGLAMIVQAHAVTSIPDMDADNIGQTLQEALQVYRSKGRGRLVENDKQFMAPWPIRVANADKLSIYHKFGFWILGEVDPLTAITETAIVARKLLENELSEEITGDFDSPESCERDIYVDAF